MKRRATLNSRWWKDQIAMLRYCQYCGGKLLRRFVRAEKKWRRVCATCGQITYVNPKVVAGVIPVLPDGRVVLLQRDLEPGLGRWSYPAGFQEIGESVWEAASRETKEEICVPVKAGDLIGIYSYTNAGVVTLVFEGKVPVGHLPQVGVETRAVKAYQIHEIPWRKLAFPSTVHALQDWIHQKRSLPRRQAGRTK